MKSLMTTALVLAMLAVGLVPVIAEEGEPRPDGSLIVNGDSIEPDLICAGVDGAVVFTHGATRYIAGFEGGPFLRVILSDGEVIETSAVTFEDDPSDVHARGSIHGEFTELAVTMYLDDGLPDCPALSAGDEQADQTPGTTTHQPRTATTEPPTTTTTAGEPQTSKPGLDGPPLVINGDPISPDLVCAGVDGAVVFVDGETRYIAGFEGGPFLRVILSDGEVLETDDVTLRDDASGGYARGVLVGEIPEARITLYLADGLSDCPPS